MSLFSTYLELGFEHISDLSAYDHILFVVALCAIYKWTQWRTVLILVTAFTIGHSITLALAALHIIPVHTKLIEFLIPVTIFLTAIYNVTRFAANFDKKSLYVKYFFAIVFGLIHGMGFSNYFSMLISKRQSIIELLFPFNVGIELGQLLIVGCSMLAAFISMHLFKIKQREWNLFVSGAVAGMALLLMMETKFW